MLKNLLLYTNSPLCQIVYCKYKTPKHNSALKTHNSKKTIFVKLFQEKQNLNIKSLMYENFNNVPFYSF